MDELNNENDLDMYSNKDIYILEEWEEFNNLITKLKENIVIDKELEMKLFYNREYIIELENIIKINKELSI